MTIKQQLDRWTDSETWRGNLTLVVLLVLALVSWFGCVPDRSGLLEGIDADVIADGQPPGLTPDAAPDAVPPFASDAAPDAVPVLPDVAATRACDDTTNPCGPCLACTRGVCTPADEHEACGPQSCDGTTIVGRVCHGGACAPPAVVKDCIEATTCKFDDSGRPYIVPGICTKMQGRVACAQDRAAYRYCDRTCGQTDGGVWQCRNP